MVEPAALRHRLVESLCEQVRKLSDPVASALRAVPRHVFVPDVPVEQAYRDESIVTKRDADGVPLSSSSQPAIMAIMLDQLGVRPGDRVLEIGTGTGYNAALLAHVVGESGEVVTVDIDADLVAAAARNLAAAGVSNVTTVCADGVDGHAELAPYDRLIATVGVWDVSPSWLEQLTVDGRMVVPLDLRGTQLSIAFERSNGRWESRSVEPCGFMRLRGSSAGPEQILVLDQARQLVLAVPDARVVDAPSVRAAIETPAVVHTTGVSARSRAIFGGLTLWVASVDPRVCYLSSEDARPAVVVHAPVAAGDRRATVGLVEGANVAVLGGKRPAGGVRGDELTLEAHGYGPRGDALAAELARMVLDWDAGGRPSTQGLRVSAYPRTAVVDDDALVIDKVHIRLVLTW